MEASLKYTRKARYDLHNITKYIGVTLKAPVAAKNIYNKICNKCKLISITPEAYPHYMKTEPKYIKKYRTASVNNYTIFYKYNKKKNEVKIVRVIYSKRHYENIIHMVNLD